MSSKHERARLADIIDLRLIYNLIVRELPSLKVAFIAVLDRDHG